MRTNLTLLLFFVSTLSYCQILVGDTIFTSGQVVELSAFGNRIAVTGPSPTKGSGITSIFDLVNGEWIQIGESIPGNLMDYENENMSMALSGNGNRIILGKRTAGGGFAGEVSVLELQNNNWIQIGRTLKGVQDDFFGDQVAISKDGTVIAASAFTGSASDGFTAPYVKVFTFNGENWIQFAGTLSYGRVFYDFNDISLTEDGTELILGLNDHLNASDGIVQRYRLLNDAWVYIRSEIRGQSDSRAGSSIDHSGESQMLVVGSPFFSNNLDKIGNIILYKIEGEDYLTVGDTLYGGFDNQQLGFNVNFASEDSILAVSSYYESNSTLPHVECYRLENNSWKFLTNFEGSKFDLNKKGNRIAISNNNKTLVYDLESSVSLNAINFQNDLFEIYPNPNSGNFTISFKEIGVGTKHIQIYNSIGQLKFLTECNVRNFDYSNINRKLSPGFYIVRVEHEDRFKTAKIIIN